MQIAAMHITIIWMVTLKNCVLLMQCNVTTQMTKTSKRVMSVMPLNLTDEKESPQEAQPARENSSLGYIKAVHHLKA